MPRNNKIDAPQPDKPGSTEVVILLQADTGPALAEGEIMAGETIKLELEEEKRKAALAVASLAEERRRLAVTQAALEEERRRTEAAKAALEAEKLKTLEAFQALEAN